MKKKNTTIYFLLVLSIFFLLNQYISAQQKSSAEARLVVDSYYPKKDSTITLGVLINLQDGWHIYWRNPGDSGLPTDIEIILPNGITASEIIFPIPRIFASDEIINYGYEHQVLFLFDLNIPRDYSLKETNVSAKITSLICKEMCKAFDTTITISLDIAKEFIADDNVSALFKSTKEMLAQKNHKLSISAFSKSDFVYLKILFDQIEDQSLSDFHFYPYEGGVFRNSTEQSITQKENYVEALLEPDPFRTKDPTTVEGLLIFEKGSEKNQIRKAFEIRVPIKK
jgi:thiol:disulfide interchange protein DsbD